LINFESFRNRPGYAAGAARRCLSLATELCCGAPSGVK